MSLLTDPKSYSSPNHHYTFTISTVGQAASHDNCCCHPWAPCNSSTTAHCNLSQLAVHLLVGNLTSTAPHSTQQWVTTQTNGSRGHPKYEAPLLLYSTFLRKVRGHFLSLVRVSWELGGVEGVADRGSNKEKANSVHTIPTFIFLSSWHCWELEDELSDILFNMRNLLRKF